MTTSVQRFVADVFQFLNFDAYFSRLEFVLQFERLNLKVDIRGYI